MNATFEDLINNLNALGLSKNEAKVYALLLKHGGWISLKEISRSCGIHVQDVYKIILSLEEKGLVIKTQPKPIKVSPIPPKIGLTQLLSSMKNNYHQKIKVAEEAYEQIERQLSKVSLSTTFTRDKKAKLLVLKGDKICMSFTQYLLKGLIDEVIIMVSYKIPLEWLFIILEEINNIRRAQLKMRILLLFDHKESKNFDFFEQIFINIKKINLDVKIMERECDKNVAFAVYDSKMVCIPLTTIEDEMIVLATEAPEIVDMAVLFFEKLWSHPATKFILSSSVRNHK